MPASFDESVIELRPRLRAFIRQRVNSPADAEDALQDTLLKAYRARCTLRENGCLEAWMYRLARNTIIDLYRTRRSTVEFGEFNCALPGVGDGPDDSLTDRAMKARIVVARAAECYLGTLSVEYRMAVRLADYECLPHLEVARRLEISLTAAKSRIRRGKQQVRLLLEGACHLFYDCQGRVVDYEVRRATCA